MNVPLFPLYVVWLRRLIPSNALTVAILLAAFTSGCGTAPSTSVVLDNQYAPSSPLPLVVYRAAWQAVSFSDPIVPGASSGPQSTVPASTQPAYVVIAPGWDPTSATKPTSLIVLQSRNGFAVDLDDTLHIPVADATFVGNCATGNALTQTQADVLTQLVFPDVFATWSYDAATCTVTPIGGAGAH